MNRPAITVVIPSRGMEPLLALCVQHTREALQQAGANPGDRIVLIDNATPEPLDVSGFGGDDIVWIRFDEHHSFSACCNVGIKKAPNPFYLMLNNDVILHRDAVAAMLRGMDENKQAGIMGSRLVFPSGQIQHCGIRFGNTDFLLYHEHRTIPSSAVPRGTHAYQAVTGACMLIRGEVVEVLKGFDERYPFYFEDIDFCFRARRRGWLVMCCNDVDSIHFESMTTGDEKMNPEAKAIFLARWEGRWPLDG